MKHVIVVVTIIFLFAVLCCDSDPNDEQCARICADRYGKCEHDCKIQYTVNSTEYLHCKGICEDKYNTCVFNCY